jgi:mono/diheme cytochrome c family protein
MLTASEDVSGGVVKVLDPEGCTKHRRAGLAVAGPRTRHPFRAGKRMMNRFIFALALASIAVTTPAALAQAQSKSTDPVDVGRDFALQVCSACHVVGPTQHFAPILSQPAPSFVSIARRPQVTADTLKQFISSRHEDIVEPDKMPNQSLIDSQLTNVVAYIVSLKPASASKTVQPAPRAGTRSTAKP